jgi:hypothetical protein
MGGAACRELLRMIDTPDAPATDTAPVGTTRVELPTALVLRESTGPVPARAASVVTRAV